MKVNNVFKDNGLLAKHFPKYENREGQLKMANLVDKAIKEDRSAVIEGATGIGKGFAYLVPAILNNENVIISTSNKTLQDQLSNKDLPILKTILKKDFTWVVLKGKNNYFCHKHFDMNRIEMELFYKKEGLSKTEAKLEMKKILNWAKETKDGDIEYYPEELPREIKEMITCDSATIHEKGAHYTNLCFAIKAREKAKCVNILLINHTLLVLDIALKKRSEGKAKILPDVNTIIIDEAHTFERYASMAFSDEINIFSLLHFLNWYLVKEAIDKDHLKSTRTAFSDCLRRLLPEKGIRGYYKQEQVVKIKDFEKVISMLYKIIEEVKTSKKIVRDEINNGKVQEIIKEGYNLIDRLKSLGIEDDNILRWVEANDGRNGKPIVRIKSVPIDVSKILKDSLFKEHKVICTSATLAVNNNFNFFKRQVGLPEDTLELIIESPFDFKKNSLIYVSSGEQEKFMEIQKLLEYSKGRAFVLFTSYRDMRECYEMVDIPYTKLIQNINTSRANLLKEFKTVPNSVLFATKSFWEGIDVRGNKLSMVIIHKLPFESPSDLIYSNKIKKIDMALGRGKSWITFTVPDTCLKLKQGIGRLIRSKTDRGVIALLDSRINYKSYGKAIMNIMPPAYRTQKLENVKSFFDNNE